MEKNNHPKKNFLKAAGLVILVPAALFPLIYTIQTRDTDTDEEFLKQVKEHTLSSIAQLDVWVAQGETPEDTDTRLTKLCNELVLGVKPANQKNNLRAVNDEESEFMIDFCVESTAHRIRPQPEFANSKMADKACNPENNGILKLLCLRAGLVDPYDSYRYRCQKEMLAAGMRETSTKSLCSCLSDGFRKFSKSEIQETLTTAQLNPNGSLVEKKLFELFTDCSMGYSLFWQHYE